MRVSQPFRTAPVKARARRRSFPIHAYIGANGGGKSLAAVYDTLPTLAAGRPVVSTVRLLDPATGEPHPLWVPLKDYRTLLEVEFCDVILDEVTGVASSRESSGMPAVVANHLVQLRRRDIALRWTAPNWKRADTIIRECSQGVTLCMGFVPERITPDPTVHDGPHDVRPNADQVGHAAADYSAFWCAVEGEHTHADDRLWSSKRLFYWRTYDAAAFDEWTAYRKEKVRPVARQLHWRPGHIASAAYDTFDAVLSLGAVTESGLCMECDGHRQKKPCQCEDYVAARRRPSRGDTPPASPRRRRQGVEVSPTVLLPETDETPAVLVDTSTL
jgi:hypothetical protein